MKKSDSDAKIFNRLKSSIHCDGKYDSIGEVGLLLANLTLPENDLAHYKRELDIISSDMDIVSVDANTLRDQIKSLTDVLYYKHGYHGDINSYDDFQNANLMRVIDRKKGLPVALGILVMHAARSQKWNICGLNFPGHFLLRLSRQEEFVIIDPFDEARLMGSHEIESLLKGVYGYKAKLRPGFIQKVSDRDILIRLQNNIKIRALKGGQNDLAIEILSSMNSIAPMKVDIILELTSLESDQGFYQSAMQRLDKFLELYPKVLGVDRIIARKDAIRSILN